MRLAKIIKSLLVLGSVLGVVVWLTAPRTSQAVGRSPVRDDKPAASDYVGSDTCKDCHEDQFKAYSHTAHGQLTRNELAYCEVADQYDHADKEYPGVVANIAALSAPDKCR